MKTRLVLLLIAILVLHSLQSCDTCNTDITNLYEVDDGEEDIAKVPTLAKEEHVYPATRESKTESTKDNTLSGQARQQENNTRRGFYNVLDKYEKRSVDTWLKVNCYSWDQQHQYDIEKHDYYFPSIWIQSHTFLYCILCNNSVLLGMNKHPSLTGTKYNEIITLHKHLYHYHLGIFKQSEKHDIGHHLVTHYLESWCNKNNTYFEGNQKKHHNNATRKE
jgi:hypothetical protein